MQTYLDRCQYKDQWRPYLNESELLLDSSLAELQRWLMDKGSLTQRLTAQFDRLEYRLLSAQEQVPWQDEQDYLQIDGAPCWTRQVWFGENNRDFVFSKVVVPSSTLAAVGATVIDWGSQPLGKLLFCGEGSVRDQLQLKYLGSSSPYLKLAQGVLNCSYEFAWARRSVCSLEGYPLLIIDLFLPDLVRELNGC